MPVYFFSFHAYRSWMPDHKRGYTRRGEGYCPSDPAMARHYERNARHEPTLFDADMGRLLIEELIDSCGKVRCRLHAGATEPTHLHVLVSWQHPRDWLSVRKSLKASITKRLKKLDGHIALSRGASRKHVRDRDHFEYLTRTYLPRIVAWHGTRTGDGFFKPARKDTGVIREIPSPATRGVAAMSV